MRNMTFLAQITSGIPNGILEKLARKNRIQTQLQREPSFSPPSFIYILSRTEHSKKENGSANHCF